MSTTIRTFIAVPVTPPASLLELCARLAAVGRGVKAVHSANMHVTLKFLGETPRHQIEAIDDVLCEAASRVEPGPATVRGFDAFPNRVQPSVLWAGLAGAEQLPALAGSLESALDTLGFPRERRDYTPHLTLARVTTGRGRRRGPAPDLVLELLEEFSETEFGWVTIDRVVLYQSRPGPDLGTTGFQTGAAQRLISFVSANNPVRRRTIGSCACGTPVQEPGLPNPIPGPVYKELRSVDL